MAAQPLWLPPVHETELDPLLPLIYQFEVIDARRGVVARYIGKSSRGAARPRNDYANNVRRLLKGLPYRGGEYRRVHLCLATAVVRGSDIRVSLIRNVRSDEDINIVERGYRFERQEFCDCQGHVEFKRRQEAIGE